MIPQRKVGKKQKRGEEKLIWDPEDEREDYFPMEEEGEVNVPFEVNEVNFRTDLNGIEYFASRVFNQNSNELAKLIMGVPQLPNKLTSVVKVTQEIGKDVEMKDKGEDVMDEDEDDEPPIFGGGGSKKDEDYFSHSSTWKWETDIYGIVSLVNISANRGVTFMKNFANYLVNSTPNESTKNEMMRVLNDSCALIVNEHVVNLPFEVSSLLHKNLLAEFKSEVNENNMPAFKYFILLAKAYENVEKVEFEYRKKKVKSTAIFVNPEEEFYFNRSLLNYRIEVKNTHSFDSSTPGLKTNVKVFKYVVVVQREKLRKIIKSIEKNAPQGGGMGQNDENKMEMN